MVARKITDEQIKAEYATALKTGASLGEVARKYDMSRRVLQGRLNTLGIDWRTVVPRVAAPRSDADVAEAMQRQHDGDMSALEVKLAEQEQENWQLKAALKAAEDALTRAEMANQTTLKPRDCGELMAIMPDTHGCYCDPAAMDAFFADLRLLQPDTIVGLGDHVDCAGFLSSHPNKNLDELGYTYKHDIEVAASHFDQIDAICPRATKHILEGNHSARFRANTPRLLGGDAGYVAEMMEPAKLLRFEDRGYQFVYDHQYYDGLPLPGSIKLGKCIFVHGWCHNKHASHSHVMQACHNVVHGHTHRRQESVVKTMHGVAMGRSYGCLSELNPTYMRGRPSDWCHGYGIHLIDRQTGNFLPVPVHIENGRSLLPDVINLLGL